MSLFFYGQVDRVDKMLRVPLIYWRFRTAGSHVYAVTLEQPVAIPTRQENSHSLAKRLMVFVSIHGVAQLSNHTSLISIHLSI